MTTHTPLDLAEGGSRRRVARRSSLRHPRRRAPKRCPKENQRLLERCSGHRVRALRPIPAVLAETSAWRSTCSRQSEGKPRRRESRRFHGIWKSRDLRDFGIWGSLLLGSGRLADAMARLISSLHGGRTESRPNPCLATSFQTVFRLERGCSCKCPRPRTRLAPDASAKKNGRAFFDNAGVRLLAGGYLWGAAGRGPKVTS